MGASKEGTASCLKPLEEPSWKIRGLSSNGHLDICLDALSPIFPLAVEERVCAQMWRVREGSTLFSLYVVVVAEAQSKGVGRHTGWAGLCQEEPEELGQGQITANVLALQMGRVLQEVKLTVGPPRGPLPGLQQCLHMAASWVLLGFVLFCRSANFILRQILPLDQR